MVVDAGSEKRELDSRVGVLACQLLEVSDDLELRERRIELEWPREANTLWNVPEELLDRRNPDRREHLVAIAIRQR